MLTANGIVLDNRKLAIVFWAIAALVLCLAKREIRSSLFDVLKAAITPKIAVPLVGMLLYVGGIVVALRSIDLWTFDLLADTVFWLVGTGMVLFFVVYDRARTDPHFFRRTVIRLLSTVVIFEFIVDLYPLPLLAELMLVPSLVLLGALLAFSATRVDLAPVSTLLNRVLTIVGLTLLAYGVARVARHLASFGSIDTARTFAVPVLLTITFLPFAYAIAVYGNLDGMRAELRWLLKDDIQLYKYARRRVLRTVGLRLRAVLRAESAPWHLMLSHPSSRIEVDRVIDHIKGRTPNALSMSIPTEARLQQIATEQPPGWEYLLFAARLDAGATALANGHNSVDMTGRAFETARNRRKAIERLQRDNQEAAALVDDIERIFDSDEILETFGAPGEPGDADRIVALAEVLILKRDRFRHWTNRARATTASEDLAVLLATHAALLDQPSSQLEEYIERWIELGEQLPQLLSSAEQSSEPVEIEMALIITVDDHALERFMDELERLSRAA